MTKEEVARVIAYCDENKISYKQRLAELGVNPWSFYDAKRKYAPKEEGENAGEFLQLVPEGTFLPNPIKPSRSRSSQNSRIGKAISYTLPLLPRLSRYVNDGRFCIDNNLVENAIRPLALGRKNFLFCGNHDAAIRAAIVYSLVDSCKALDVDPREWMEDVLLRIPGNENNREALRELLPDKWAKQTN